MKDSRITAGEVGITLDGAPATLRPTVGAGIAINQMFGNLQEAHRRVQALDLEATGFIVAKAIGARDGDIKSVTEKVFATGLQDLRLPVMQYIAMLTNGGKPINPEPDEGNGEATS